MLGVFEQALPAVGELITSWAALHELAAEMLFKLRHSAVDRGLASAEHPRRRQGATSTGYGQEILQVVPVEHELGYPFLPARPRKLAAPRATQCDIACASPSGSGNILYEALS